MTACHTSVTAIVTISDDRAEAKLEYSELREANSVAIRRQLPRHAVQSEPERIDLCIVAVAEPGEIAEHPLVQGFVLLHLVLQLHNKSGGLVAIVRPHDQVSFPPIRIE